MLSRKEGKVDKFIQKHIEEVGLGLQTCRETLFAYLAGDWEKFKQMAEATDSKESDADAVRREAEDALYSGSYISVYREDFSILLDLIDNIADDAEAIADFLLIETPKVPSQWGEMLKQIMEKTLESFSAFRRCFLLLYEDMEKAYSTTKEVRNLEKEIDLLQDDLLRQIFQSDLSLVEKIHLRELVLKLGQISDSAENASDKVRGLALKTGF
jgi:hypothetical protein